MARPLPSRPLPTEARAVTPAAPTGATPSRQFRSADFAGTVISADAPYEELPDPQPGRTLLLILYALPLLPLALSLLVFLLMLIIPLRLLGVRGFSLWPWLTLFGLLGRRGGEGVRTVPVRNLRLRDTGGREQQVRIKGRLAGGMADRGDSVLVWGRLRDGVLHLRHGLNLRTNARIRLQTELPLGVIIPATIGWLAILWLLLLPTVR